jgi:hypothetical protein
VLTIHDFEVNYHIAPGIPERAGIQQRLDRMVQSRLVDLLDARLAALPADNDAVYCIQHIHLDLWLDMTQLTDVEIAERWGNAITKAIQYKLLYGQPGEVVRFESAAHYLASFIEHVLSAQAWSRWLFESYHMLRDVPPGRAIAMTLSGRRDLLYPVLGLLQRRQILDRCIDVMTPTDVALLWTRGFGFNQLPDIPAESIQEAWLSDFLTAPMETGQRGARARNSLRLYLAAALQQRHLTGSIHLAALARHVAWLHAIRVISPRFWTHLIADDLTSDALLALIPDDMTTARRWLRHILNSDDGRAYLQTIEAHLGGAAQDTSKTTVLRTPFAGLGLLLPQIRQMGWWEHIGNAGIYQLLLAACGQTLAPLAWGDQAIPRLAGIDPQLTQRARETAIDWEALLATLDERAPPDDSAYLADTPAAAAVNEIYRRFAAGIRGFQDSTLAYLSKQFVYLPGDVHLSDDARLDIYLNRAPLGILLRMSGRDGERGALPWLANRQLVIHLPGG